MPELAVACYVIIAMIIFHGVTALDVMLPKWWPNKKGVTASLIAVSAFWPIAAIAIPIAVVYVFIDEYRKWLVKSIQK